MVTVLGHRGMLGSVVARRWAELGADGDYIVNCTYPDDLALITRLASRPGLIQPSSDAIDEATDYAAGKRAIEAIPGIVVIRCGIVDITKQPAVAYRNWYCNPLTPLEWADLAWEVRDHPGVHVAGRETVSRYDIAKMLAVSGLVLGRVSGLSRVQPIDRPRPPLAEALADYLVWLG